MPDMREIRGTCHRSVKLVWLVRNSRCLRGVLALAVAGAAAVGCGSAPPAAAGPSSPKPGGQPLVVAAVPAPGAAALYIAEQRGLFAKTGLNVRIESTVSASAVLADLVNGSVSVVLGQWTSALAAEAGGVRLRVIAPGNDGGPGLEQLVTSHGSGITTIGQLRGKVIAVNALGGLPQALTDSVLADGGIPVQMVRYAAVPFPDMAAALAHGEVAAAFMVAPYLTQAASQLRVLADIDQHSTTKGIPVTGYYASQAWAASHRAQLTAFTGALSQGQHLAAAEPPTARQAFASYTGVSTAVAAKMPLGTFPGSVGVADLSRVGTLMQAYGLLPRAVKITALASGMIA